jgi:hypothetical protein
MNLSDQAYVKEANMRKPTNECWVLGLVFAEAFAIAVLRDFLTPFPGAVRYWFEIFLPGFRWNTPATFPLGAIESFFWGAYLELVMLPIAKMFWLKHHNFSGPGPKTPRLHHHAA